jgi:Fur family transcriptional regulator, zinc uptake regulator
MKPGTGRPDNDHAHDHSHAHDHAHHHGAAEPTKLTRNQALVLGALEEAKAPLSAYSILDVLRHDGFRAPLQVYRALEKLVEAGLVHRLESLNAFVACQHRGCETQGDAAFAICGSCGKVEEVQDGALMSDIQALSSRSGFRLSRSVVELRGTCAACADA